MLERLYEIGGDHEIALRNHFGDAVHFRGRRVFDTPLYLLAFSNRSGSNLLAEYLRAVPGLAGFYEELNHFDVTMEAEQRGLASLPDYVASKASAAMPSAYGFKANWEQLAMVFKFGLHQMFAGVRIIRVERKDVIAQAVSYSIASQRRIWRSTDVGPARPPVFNYDSIARFLRVAIADNHMIQLVSTLAGVPCFRVYYEDVVAKPTETLRGVLDFTGIKAELDAGFVPQYERQATHTNDQFIEQFLSMARARTICTTGSSEEATS